MSDILCRIGWHGGITKMDTYCVDFGHRWALMECSRCGERHIWERGYLTYKQLDQLSEKTRPPQTF